MWNTCLNGPLYAFVYPSTIRCWCLYIQRTWSDHYMWPKNSFPPTNRICIRWAPYWTFNIVEGGFGRSKGLSGRRLLQHRGLLTWQMPPKLNTLNNWRANVVVNFQLRSCQISWIVTKWAEFIMRMGGINPSRFIIRRRSWRQEMGAIWEPILFL